METKDLDKFRYVTSKLDNALAQSSVELRNESQELATRLMARETQKRKLWIVDNLKDAAQRLKNENITEDESTKLKSFVTNYYGTEFTADENALKKLLDQIQTNIDKANDDFANYSIKQNLKVTSRQGLFHINRRPPGDKTKVTESTWYPSLTILSDKLIGTIAIDENTKRSSDIAALLASKEQTERQSNGIQGLRVKFVEKTENPLTSQIKSTEKNIILYFVKKDANGKVTGPYSFEATDSGTALSFGFIPVASLSTVDGKPVDGFSDWNVYDVEYKDLQTSAPSGPVASAPQRSSGGGGSISSGGGNFVPLPNPISGGSTGGSTAVNSNPQASSGNTISSAPQSTQTEPSFNQRNGLPPDAKVTSYDTSSNRVAQTDTCAVR